MKIWLLSQDEIGSWDTYDSCVVFAESEEIAKTITPEGKRIPDVSKPARWHLTWTNDPEKVTAMYLGEAAPGSQEGVILGSFNAG